MKSFLDNLAAGGHWSFLEGNFAWVAYGLLFSLTALFAIAWMNLMALVWTYGERRIAGVIQGRLGPNRVGPEGTLQPLADAIKLLTKEDLVPANASRVLYTLGPVLVFVGALLPFVALPFSPRLQVVSMELALFYILAFESIEVIGVLMAGWAPGSKWSLYGGMRLAAQMLAYEIPMGLAVMVIILLSGTFNLAEIVAWQASPAFGLENPGILGWAIFRSPAAALGFVIFFVAGFAATKRAPFDLPEAESELVAGYHTEYSGMRFAFFFLAEYATMFVVCALCALLFLGGWSGPFPRFLSDPELSLITIWTGAGSLVDFFSSGELWRIVLSEGMAVTNFLLKTFTLYFIMVWVRWTLPRVRIDQVLHMCLKVFLPFSLVCVLWALAQVTIASM